MANSRLLVLWIALSIALVGIRAEPEEEVASVEPEASDSPLQLEIEQLRSKISSIESSLHETTKLLTNKEAVISDLERVVQEKSGGIAALQAEIDSLQRNGAVDAEEQVGKAHARAGELEKEVGKLRAEKGTLTRKIEALEARTGEAEKKVEELRLQLENIHEAWLPPWFATHIGRLRDIAGTEWNEHGKPAMDIFLKKVSEKSAQAQKWAEPHVERANTKWIPAVKEKWATITTSVQPHVQTISTKSVEVYEVCRSTVTPHVVKAKEVAAPYVQEAKKLSKPYVDQIATVTKPHVEKVRVVMKPYTNRAVYAYGKFLESATTCHHQVQVAVEEKLKRHELTKHLATKELVWFMASAVLALPVFFLYKLFSSIFCKKARKPSDPQTSHAHRRHKRRHADK